MPKTVWGLSHSLILIPKMQKIGLREINTISGSSRFKEDEKRIQVHFDLASKARFILPPSFLFFLFLFNFDVGSRELS